MRHTSRRYDPNKTLDVAWWSSLDEDERIDAVVKYHRRRRIELPSEQAHALFHVIIENQIAMGDEIPVAATLDRLLSEGMSRHDAVHAISSVLAWYIHEARRGDRPSPPNVNADYFGKLHDLTEASWIEEFS